MRKIVLTLLFALSFLNLMAQEDRVVKGGCTPEPMDGSDATADAALLRSGVKRRLPSVNKNWDPNKTYRQLVILVTFKRDSTYFKMENPLETYERMFNEPGYNQRSGKGCVAEYFSEQSNGLFNMQFDVYGPYEVNQKAQPYDNPTEDTKNYGRNAMIEATNMFLAEHGDLDFSVYDWNGDHKVNQVIYVFAGYCGNQNKQKVYGYLWPNTSTFTTITTTDGYKISDYTASAELWSNGNNCGMGTICHEFTHSLGLPDIYPTNGKYGYSAVDEWDLMDGGNFTNYGWCPPNYTSMEKWLLGWLDFVDLEKNTTIVNWKPVSEGGEVYRIKHSDSEWLLLENRQQTGWDAGVPGEGMTVFHVYYDASIWRGNSVNNTNNHRFRLLPADNLADYEKCYEWVIESGKTGQYQNSNRMNGWIFSRAPYPLLSETGEVINNALTDDTTPSTTMDYNNLEGTTALAKPITNITMASDGTISFNFMGGGIPLAVQGVNTVGTHQCVQHFDLQGRPISASQRGLHIVRSADGIIKKFLR